MMRLVTWNINSVRLRASLILDLITQKSPDIICLQETKCPNENFPKNDFIEAGYPHIAINGIKGYHGVAILSRIPFAAPPEQIDYCGQRDGRHLRAYFAVEKQNKKNILMLDNFYVPAGGDIPDLAQPKFAHKLAFIDEMTTTYSTADKVPTPWAILVGDFNIAPGEHDVWSSRKLQNVVSHTPIERKALAKLQSTLDWDDLARRFVPPEHKLYSWWSYRAQNWAVSDRGRRLDHIWSTPSLTSMVTNCTPLRDARGWNRPSDHVPVIADFNL